VVVFQYVFKNGNKLSFSELVDFGEDLNGFAQGYESEVDRTILRLLFREYIQNDLALAYVVVDEDRFAVDIEEFFE